MFALSLVEVLDSLSEIRENSMTIRLLTNHHHTYLSPRMKVSRFSPYAVLHLSILLLLGLLALPTLASSPMNDEVLKASRTLAREVTGADGAPMVLIPAGQFKMGSVERKRMFRWEKPFPDELPAHTVNLDAFYMDKYEVTIFRYVQFLRATGRQQDLGEWNRYNPLSKGDRPVSFINWDDGHAYCEYYGKRLPTEAEWEKAARGSDGRLYPWGNDFPRQSRHMRSSLPPKAVGSYEGGKSPYGIYDMVGNVEEWVADWYAGDYYFRSPQNNPQGPSMGKAKVIRGEARKSARSAVRSFCPPKLRQSHYGFRCAQDIL